jgi:hypothetical protein
MARRTFFSFHYERDIWRANVVRNCWVTQDRQAAGFFDASLWEEAKKKSTSAIHSMILEGLRNTSVTAVLIGAETANRDYINFEIIESHKRANGLFGVYIANINNQRGESDTPGANPFDFCWLNNPDGTRTYFSRLYPVYWWYTGEGHKNFGTWVEKAAKTAGR